ncbi:GH25 family lysozyme [Lactococcus lactis]|uniref:GH25 family lysozyme n=1 Tax=Lactococcus lactis TaxID=1358 RepID=UPI0019147771|nr:GH25 family lysozyme [Lactococcus lactis]WDA68600.1 GH25 family lysozyme [Lactococcus lactis]
MKLKKSHIIPLILFSGLLIAKPVFAEDNVSQDDHPMGYYIKQEQEQQASDESTSTDAAEVPSIRARSFAAAIPAANAPDILYSDNTSLPRKDAVDISSHQSWMVQADFNAIKAAGVKTVIIKLTEGTGYINPYASSQIQMAKSAGLNIAVYHYATLQGANSQDAGNSLAVQEANYFANTAKKLGLSTNIVMIMDCEQPYKDSSGKIIGPNPANVDWATAAAKFASQLKSQGYSNTIFYTSSSWLGTNTATCQMNYNTLGGAKKVWAAQYLYGTPSSNNLKNTQYGAWQYTSQMLFKGGTSNLLNNNLDTSIDYNNIFSAPSQNLQDVYRLYNANTGEHFYTLNFAEKTNLQNVGWRYEGIGWLSSSTGSPVYRVYNPNAKGGDHYYTMSKYEAQQLVSKGWRWDNNGGAAFYSNGSKNLYVAYNPNASSGSHNYTTNSYEQDNLLRLGWKYGAVAWKVN